MACTGNCSNRRVSHVITFDGTNLPLWRLGLNVALEEAGVQFVTDGTEPISSEVHIVLLSMLSLLTVTTCSLVSIETNPDIALTIHLLSSSTVKHIEIFQSKSRSYLSRKEK